MLAAIDPFWTALFGTVIGGTIVVVGQLINVRVADRRDKDARAENDRQERKRERDSELRLLQDLAGEFYELVMNRIARTLTRQTLTGTFPDR